jgi:RpiR family transcriptional regulator, carbohydrate utilization regulator
MYKVINQLKERNFGHSISNSEEAVFDYLEKNFKTIPKITVTQLADKSFTSQATVNRACKTLGFFGFSELKFAIAQDLQLMNTVTTRHISRTENILSKIYFEGTQQVVKQILDGNRKVLLFGLGASDISAQYFQRQLLYFGIPTIIIEQEKMLDNFRDYLLFVLSSSGETMRCLQLVKRAKELNMTVLAITKSRSSLTNHCDAAFLHDVPVDKLDGISREQQLHMIIMLNEIIDQIDFELKARRKQSNLG